MLGIALIAMGEEIGSEMALRTFGHLVSPLRVAEALLAARRDQDTSFSSVLFLHLSFDSTLSLIVPFFLPLFSLSVSVVTVRRAHPAQSGAVSISAHLCVQPQTQHPGHAQQVLPRRRPRGLTQLHLRHGHGGER